MYLKSITLLIDLIDIMIINLDTSYHVECESIWSKPARFNNMRVYGIFNFYTYVYQKYDARSYIISYCKELHNQNNIILYKEKCNGKHSAVIFNINIPWSPFRWFTLLNLC
jgi:hypothetical protein